jgi:hypothetical protein
MAATGAAYGINATSVQVNEQQTQSRAAHTFEINQPIPTFQYSQYRQTLIDIEGAQAHGIATTTFGYSSIANAQGQPSWTCPSLGFPIASTSQLSNPTQPVNVGGGNGDAANPGVAVGQMEPNGTYTGDSSGTYVVCVGANNVPYVRYEEGYVSTVGGPATYVPGQGEVLTGNPTVTTSGGK